MSEVIKNRSEILFLYDVTDANPNGDLLMKISQELMKKQG